jgi:hypothetical protein
MAFFCFIAQKMQGLGCMRLPSRRGGGGGLGWGACACQAGGSSGVRALWAKYGGAPGNPDNPTDCPRDLEIWQRSLTNPDSELPWL